MTSRCPGSTPLFPAELPNFDLVFQANSKGRNVANVRPLAGGKVVGALYALTATDLAALDAKEGHPKVYCRSKMGLAKTSGERVEAWVYVMHFEEVHLGPPAPEYLKTIERGYDDWGLDRAFLATAVKRTTDNASTSTTASAPPSSSASKAPEVALYLSELFVRNFRIFGSTPDDHFEMRFAPGLTVLVGENDAGKSAILDAIRLALGTTARDGSRLSVEDFHLHPVTGKREQELEIRCRFAFTNDADAAIFAEYIIVEDGHPILYVTLRASLADAESEEVGLRRGIAVDIRTGKEGGGPRMDGLARNLLNVTYLKALRDATSELAAGRGSRLARILSSHKNFAGEKKSDFDPAKGDDESFLPPKSLSGIVNFIEWAIARNPLVREAQGSLNEILSQGLSLATEPLSGSVGIAKNMDLRELLEKLELFLGRTDIRTNRGLGSNNILYMAAELLLLRSSNDGGLPMLLIEEPEAHLHPQWQLAVMDYLEDAAETAESQALQIILTTHSPTLASHVRLKHVVIIQQGTAYPLAPGHTKLDASDYRYLERFLDSTRANLFFARGVLIVEGDAEALLLPAIAEVLGRPFSRYGVSVVNVGSTGLFRYAKIFQRSRGRQMTSIAVACVADLDPSEDDDDAARERKRREIEERYNGAPVSAFVASKKTFEYDLVFAGLGLYVHRAIRLSNYFEDASSSDYAEAIRKADAEFVDLQKECSSPAALADAVYKMVKKKKAPTAQLLAQMLLDESYKKLLTREQLVSMLPRYIIDALSYVTGGSDIALG